MPLTKLQRVERDSKEANMLSAQGRHGEERVMLRKLVDEYLEYLKGQKKGRKRAKLPEQDA